METQEEVHGESPPVTPEVPAVPEIPSETVERAKTMGHIPKEEFRGDPDKWVPADKYVERADNLMPILKSQMRKYESEIGTLKGTVEAQKKTTEKLLKMSETVQKTAYDQAKRDLTAEQVQAVSDGDVEKWQKLEDQKEKLPTPEPVVAEEPQNPIFDRWAGENTWVNDDKDMALYANSYGPIVQQQNPSMSYEDILKTVETKVREVFPHKFENPNRSQPSPVDGGTNRETPPPDNKQTYTSLNAEEKAMCDQNVKDGLYKKKEDWVKVYYEEG
jgi:hypothetical protein